MAARWSAASGRRHGCKMHGQKRPRPSLSLAPSPSLLLVSLSLSPRRPLRCTPGGTLPWQRPKAPREAETPEDALTFCRAGPCSHVAARCDLIADIAGAGLAPLAATSGQSSLAENAMGNGHAAGCCNATHAKNGCWLTKRNFGGATTVPSTRPSPSSQCVSPNYLLRRVSRSPVSRVSESPPDRV